jgi:hypothetical protein
MTTVEDKKKQRLQFLHELYRLTNGNENASANMYEIGKIYNFDNETTQICVQYLEGEGLVKSQALGGRIGGLIAITHLGVKEVEQALSNPQSSTKYFPPASAVHIINVQTMTNSQIIQDSPHSKQTIDMDENKIEDIKEVIKSIRKSFDQFDLPKAQKSELQSDIQTIEAQVSSSKPKHQMINECLKSIANVLQGVGSAVPIVTRIASLLGSF